MLSHSSRTLSRLTLSAVVTAALLCGELRIARRLPAAEPAAASDDERAKALQWFGTLGFPDVKDLKFVRVATGQWGRSGDEPPANTFLNGFLLEDDGKTFRVFDFLSRTTAFTKTPQGTAAHKAVAYEVKDAAECGNALLASLRLRETDRKKADELWRPYENSHPQPAEVFLVAWACWRQGHEQLAAELFDEGAKVPDLRGDNDHPARFQERVARDMAHHETFHALYDFGNPGFSRERLLARFEWLLKNFPAGEHAALVAETVTRLKTMLQEDKEHADQRTHGEPLEKLAQQARIAELIFRLRDQNGYKWTEPGTCDIFMPLDRGKNSPAHQLVKIGSDAVPQLIEALDNNRFSRSVDHDFRAYYTPPHVLTVGDCADAILERIAGRTFYEHNQAFMTEDGQTAVAKKAVAAWYAELKKKGEKQMLIDAVEAADRASGEMAERLVEKYPVAALSAIVAGAGRAKNSWTRTQLVEQAGQISGDGPIPFLLDEVKSGPIVEARVAAARVLDERNRPEGTAAMIDEWKRCDRNLESGWQPEPVGVFLAECGKIDAIKALADGLDKRPFRARVAVVSALGEFSSKSATASRKGGERAAAKASAVQDQKNLSEAVIALLIKSLDDTEAQSGGSISRGDKSVSNPRVCDFAGSALNEIDAARFPFDLFAPFDRRDRSRAELKDVWRKAHGLPLGANK